MEGLIWVGFAVAMAGTLTWNIAAMGVTKWLTDNDPEYEAPSFASRLFLGRLFTTIGPAMRYATLRGERGESAPASAAFWGGVGLTVFGLVIVFVGLGSA
jgi:hypothetical protein